MKDIDGLVANDEIDTLNLIVPFKQNATYTYAETTMGFHGIVQFSFNYNLHNDNKSTEGKIYMNTE